ncbi:MAG: hypothetical protein A2014_06150 [Spirochaetes bacterium GWF1_49_6]|nr:MAG: hypothetical protein A2014_06150 [Spirochaetes bacterium GWF1_49_6]
MSTKTAKKPIVELYGIKKSLGGKVILDGIDLTIYEGETFVIIGQSGVGKSVTLKIIIGLMEPDEGEVYIMGENMTNASENQWTEKRKHFGMLFQGGALFDSLTVGQNILFSLDHIRHELTEDEKIDKILHSLEIVGLPDTEDIMPAELSGGMMKRVALARAIVASPEIVLFDEPTTGLDPIMTANINELIVSVKEKIKTTYIVVTHDIKSAKYVSDRIGMVYKGKLVFLGTAKELENSKDPLIRQFIEGNSQGPITEEYMQAIERIKRHETVAKNR